jgi:predicted metalloprotease with PDZ domain
MRYREDYVRWLALVSHEFFHAWNVRRLRPEALTEYDYENETYTRELWLAEGLTSYYDNLLLLRSGLITVDEYFALLAVEFHGYETTPGKDVRSAEAASFDAWIKQYKKDANTVNSVVSYYRKGSVLGFVMDSVIRNESGGKSSLDTLMREMYSRYGPDGSVSRGYPPGAFENLVEQLAGVDARKRAEELLSTTHDPDIDSVLDWYGLSLDRAEFVPDAEDQEEPVPTDFGLTWDEEKPDLVVESVLLGGSGAQAGVLPGDEILAISKLRVSKLTIQDRMLRLEPGEQVELLLSRHGRILSLNIVAQPAVPDKFLISIKPDISRKQKERMAAWLGIQLKFITR